MAHASRANSAHKIFSMSGVSSALMEKESSIEDEELVGFPEWQLACRIAESKTLSRSEFLPKFLLYVCERQLTGNAHEITEQRVGVDVFQRPAGYNPGEDNIVRNYARLLRKRLSEYFEREGIDEPLRVEIPRGGYIPRFRVAPKQPEPLPIAETQTAFQPDDSADAETGIVPPAKLRKSFPGISRSTLIMSLLSLLVGVLLWPVMWALAHPGIFTREKSPSHALWAQMFQSNRNLIIVPSDSGLGILENLTGQPVSLEDYTSGKYPSAGESLSTLDSGSINDLRKQRYTSMAALKVTSALLRLPEFIPNRSEIRDAREMSMEDFKNSNVILLGSIHTDPWLKLFEDKLNFRLQYERKVDQSYIVNANRTGAERKVYRNGETDNPNLTYGAVDYLPNLYGTGHILIIQGLNMAATQAAAEILLSSKEILPVMSKAKRPDGSLKSFELLIETNSIGATAPDAHIIAMRIQP